jgi:hypothetical protein
VLTLQAAITTTTTQQAPMSCWSDQPLDRMVSANNSTTIALRVGTLDVVGV